MNLKTIWWRWLSSCLKIIPIIRYEKFWVSVVVWVSLLSYNVDWATNMSFIVVVINLVRRARRWFRSSGRPNIRLLTSYIIIIGPFIITYIPYVFILLIIEFVFIVIIVRSDYLRKIKPVILSQQGRWWQENIRL